MVPGGYDKIGWTEGGLSADIGGPDGHLGQVTDVYECGLCHAGEGPSWMASRLNRPQPPALEVVLLVSETTRGFSNQQHNL